MPPSLRKRVVNNYPKPGDRISVLWSTGMTKQWWSAHVLNITTFDGDDPLATGCILYEKYGTFDEQISEVAFFYSKRNGLLLRETGPTSETASSTKQSTNHQSTTGTARTESEQGRKKMKISACSWLYTRDLPSEVMSNQKNISNTKLENGATTTDENSTSKHQKKHASNYQPTSSIIYAPVPSFAAASSGAAPKTTDNAQHPLHINSNPFRFHPKSINSFEKVITELRLSLLHQFQSKFKPGKCLNSGDEYLVIKTYSIHVSCTLDEFAAFCNYLHSNSDSFFPSFYPTFEATQNASLATECLQIKFNTFRHLCKSLGLRDYRDYAELVCKDGVEQFKHYLRIVGTSYSDDEEKRKDSIYVGSNVCGSEKGSCIEDKLICLSRSRTNWSSKEGRFLSSWTVTEVERGEESKLIYTSTKQEHVDNSNTEMINTEHGEAEITPQQESNVEGRVEGEISHHEVGSTSPVQNFKGRNIVKQETIEKRSDGQLANDGSRTEYHLRSDDVPPWSKTFDLTWKRSAQPSSRIWTCDALRTGDVTFGRLQVTIPTLLITGDESHSQLLPMLCNINYNIEFNKL